MYVTSVTIKWDILKCVQSVHLKIRSASLRIDSREELVINRILSEKVILLSSQKFIFVSFPLC